MNIRPAVKEDIKKLYPIMLDNGLIDQNVSEKNFYQWMEWLYWKNPDSAEKHYQLVMEDKDEIVGHYGMTALPYFCKGEGEITAGLGSWLVIDKKYRSNGLAFFKLQSTFLKNYIHKNIHFTFGPVNRSLVLNTHLKTGYQKLNDIHVYARPYNLYPIIDKLTIPSSIKKIFSSLNPIFNSFLKWSYVPSVSSRTIKKIGTFTDEIERFVIHTLFPCHMWATRSKEIMNWRFIHHPLHHYEILCVYKGQELRGYVVMLEKELKGLKTLALVDMLIADNDWKSFWALWRKIHQNARQKKVDLVAFATTHFPPMQKYLIHAGFIDTKERFTLVAHGANFNLCIPELKKDGWFATWFDHDYM